MRILSGQDALLSANQDPYLRTHPMTIERVVFLERQVEESEYGDVPASPRFIEMHRRIRERYVLELEARFFMGAEPQDRLFFFQGDDYISIEIARYF